MVVGVVEDMYFQFIDFKTNLKTGMSAVGKP